MISRRAFVATIGIVTAGCFGSAPDIDDDGAATTSTSATDSTTGTATDTPSTGDASTLDATATSLDVTSDSTSDTGDATCIEPGPATKSQCGNDSYEPGEICHAATTLVVATQGTDIAAVPAVDGPMDLVVANAGPGPGLTYMQNDGDGGFGLAGIEEVQGVYSVRVGQLDAGPPDLVVGLTVGARVLLGQGGGEFLPGAQLATDGAATRVALGSFDDGPTLDVARVAIDEPDWFTHVNDGMGGFAAGPSGSMLALGKGFVGASDLVVGRFGDASDGVVLAVVVAGFVGRFPLGGGTPGILPDPDGMGGDAVSIAAGDIDPDGIIDLVSAHDDRLRVYLGATQYQQPYDVPVDTTGAIHVAVADVDRDGRGDLVTLAHAPNRLVVMREVLPGDDPKPFEITLDAESPPSRLVVAPLDGDCVPDIALAHQGGEVTILLSEP